MARYPGRMTRPLKFVLALLPFLLVSGAAQPSRQRPSRNEAPRAG